MKSSPFTAVFDACVLYPAPLRDFLMWLALSGRFRARWTALIHDEWVRNLLRNRPELDPAQLQRTIDLMNNLFDLDQAAVVAAAQKQRSTLRNPPIDVDRYLEILLKQGLIRTVKDLAGFRSVL